MSNEVVNESKPKEFSVCRRCGHGLTDPKSRKLGIGPICMKYLLIQSAICKLRNEEEGIGITCSGCGKVVPYGRPAIWMPDTMEVYHTECLPEDMIPDPEDFQE